MGKPKLMPVMMYSRLYSAWSKFLHKHNYHYMPLSYPGGDTQAWCHWCGLRSKVITKADIEKAMLELAAPPPKNKEKLDETL